MTSITTEAILTEISNKLTGDEMRLLLTQVGLDDKSTLVEILQELRAIRQHLELITGEGITDAD